MWASAEIVGIRRGWVWIWVGIRRKALPARGKVVPQPSCSKLYGRREPEDFPWTPSVCILVSSLCRNKENRFSYKHTNAPPSGGSPKVSKGNELPSGQSPKASFRSEAEADRSESPLVAREGETPPRTEGCPKSNTIPVSLLAATTRGLSGRPLDPFGVPSVVTCPNNKQMKIPLTKNPPKPLASG